MARRKARSSFAGFCRYVAPEEPPAEHHELICDAADKIVSGDIKRLMVLMPPGSAKSTYATVRFPAYFLGRMGDKGVITASYNDRLATRFGRKVRNLIRDGEYARVFPDTVLSADSQAKGEWETAEGGFYFATGIGGGVTGRRADLGVIDDPIKGRKDADSQLIRDNAWDWYVDDFRTRLKPGGSIVIIQTRWHQDDLAGRILPEDWDGQSGWVTARDGEEWYVICLPAKAGKNDILGREPGEWLWTDWFTPQWWEQTERTARQKDVRTWNSLYQQTPTDEQGTFFKREWFPRFELGEQPKHTHTYMSSDFAVSEGEGDFTEFGGFDLDKNAHLWVTSWWYGQEDSGVWTDAQLDMIDRIKPLAVLGETGVIRKAVEPFLKTRARERGIYARYEWINRTGDKAAMARAIQARASQGMVHIPNTPWGERILKQLTAFPAAKHDDIVDVFALIGLALDGLVPGFEPPIEENNLLHEYEDELPDDDSDEWRLA